MASTNLARRPARPPEGFYDSEVATPRPLPVRTFLPTGYEPKYAYPLLVFFHDRGSNEEQILRLAPHLSRRNYICIGLRGLYEVGIDPKGRSGFSWTRRGDCDSLVRDYVIRAVEQTRRTYHVHSERIYLAGVGEGAAVAYSLGLSEPEKFGGLIVLNGSLPRHARSAWRWPEIRQLRVFIGHGLFNPFVPMKLAQDDHRFLWTAGVDTRLHTYLTDDRVHPDMLRDIDRWIIARCNAE
ncbi:MAG: hypothetical protein NZ700_06235 [Gemmataceae bacterium]|nr:hypothetical protein [Gemmataceae bacterium]MDW8263780.1 hypothetical protein [Gemmataceae bacterium]